jgi:glycosyltransferase involved in cell wall biosynthesis
MTEIESYREPLPLLSIIVPTYKRGDYIERCLVSLFREIDNCYPNAEVIVIDGGSVDGTVELLRKYNSKITFWVSEHDSGVSEAVNKGLAKAKGEIIYIIGADDELLPGAALLMVRYLQEHPNVASVFGKADYLKESSDGTLEPLSVPTPAPGRLVLESFLTPQEVGWTSPEEQFTRRWVFERFGGFDPHYNYYACLEMWCRHAKNGVVFEQIPTIIMRRYWTPKSANMNLREQKYWRELYSILWRHGGLYWVLRSLRKGNFLFDTFVHNTLPFRKRLGLRREGWFGLFLRKRRSRV